MTIVHKQSHYILCEALLTPFPFEINSMTAAEVCLMSQHLEMSTLVMSSMIIILGLEEISCPCFLEIRLSNVVFSIKEQEFGINYHNTKKHETISDLVII